jgi:predicted alpha/beta-hydrolase family hydrolase
MPGVNRELTLRLTGEEVDRRVSALLHSPRERRALLVLAHGAGAGMRHPFLEALAEALAAEGIATLRYQFLYMENGGGRPDRPAVATAVVRAAVARAVELADGVPVYAGGKSFGGRMTSTAAADHGLPAVGLVFFGFPLHPPGKPSTSRAEHLPRVELPMLFLQGTRDRLAGLDLLRPALDGLGHRATLHVVDGADHGFAVLKRSGRTVGEVLAELAATTARWIGRTRPDG